MATGSYSMDRKRTASRNLFQFAPDLSKRAKNAEKKHKVHTVPSCLGSFATPSFAFGQGHALEAMQ